MPRMSMWTTHVPDSPEKCLASRRAFPVAEAEHAHHALSCNCNSFLHFGTHFWDWLYWLPPGPCPLQDLLGGLVGEHFS